MGLFNTIAGQMRVLVAQVLQFVQNLFVPQPGAAVAPISMVSAVSVVAAVLADQGHGTTSLVVASSRWATRF